MTGGRRTITPAGAFFAFWLVVLWTLLWGELTLANVVGGVLVAAFVLVAVPRPAVDADTAQVRPLALAAVLAWFTWKLVEANVKVAWETVRPRPNITTGVVAVPLPGCPPGILTLIANGITLTPGTLTLEVDRSAGTVYVHTMQLTTPDDVRADVYDLERRVVAAVGSAAARAAAAGRATSVGEVAS